ncbi:MAG: hypothetical protein ACI4PF_02010 [Christensenellales bacterium]
MKRFYQILTSAMLVILCSIALTACGVIEVRGKTFVYDSVSIDWGQAKEEQKQALFEEFLVSNETELLNVLKTRNQRNSRITTFGTDGKYVTRNLNNEILDEGYYKQDDEIITLAETEDGFSNPGNYTLKANEKGYIANDKLNDEYSIFARYQYVLDE